MTNTEHRLRFVRVIGKQISLSWGSTSRQ